jgi:hypothetical protein
MGLLIGAPSFLFCILLTDENKDDSFLFCLKKEIPVLEINRDNDGKFVSVNNNDIQQFIEKYSINNIEKWMPQADENDFDGDIYLNRIYSIHIDPLREYNVSVLIQERAQLPIVLGY